MKKEKKDNILSADEIRVCRLYTWYMIDLWKNYNIFNKIKFIFRVSRLLYLARQIIDRDILVTMLLICRKKSIIELTKLEN